MGKVLPSQRLLKQFEERLVFGDMNLSEIVRSGAQMMLQYALEREVTEALGRGYYENAPETTKEKGRRNGYESHRVLTGEGAVTVQVPQIRETSTGFRSKILDAYVSRTEKLDELIARMYVHGMSTRDIEATFADVLSGTGVSKSALLHGPEQIADLPVPVAESPGAVRIGHPERSHLVEYLAPNSVFNSLPRQRSSPHLRPDDRLVTIDRVLHHASLGVA